MMANGAFKPLWTFGLLSTNKGVVWFLFLVFFLLMVNVHFAKGDECKRLAMVEMGHGDQIYEGHCYWKRDPSTPRES